MSSFYKTSARELSFDDMQNMPRELFSQLPLEARIRFAEEKERRKTKGLAQAANLTRENHSILHPKYGLWLFAKEGNQLQAYVFFNTDDQLESSVKDGERIQIEHTLRESLKSVGRSDLASANISMIWDSHENVERRFNGNYDKRLR